MDIPGILPLVLLLAGGPFSAADPGAEERKAALVRITAYAREYDSRLQDFVCYQVTRRSTDASGSGKRWKKLDSYEHELTYFHRKESYKLVKVNGQPAERTVGPKRGFYQAQGQFGGYLNRIFEPGAAAEFDWERADIRAGRRICAFRYRVLQKNSKMRLRVNEFEDFVGFHGWVHADCDTGVVIRVRLEKDLPAGVPASATADFEYGPVSGREFHLPVRSEEVGRHRTTLTRIETLFTNYRKYSADATVTY